MVRGVGDIKVDYASIYNEKNFIIGTYHFRGIPSDVRVAQIDARGLRRTKIYAQS